MCEVGVRSVDNFWGYAHDSKLSFKLCPHGYCCGTETVSCTSFSTCAPGRTGLLCGSCKPDYKQNFVGGNCIPKLESCDSQVFVVYFIVYTLSYTVVFVLITNAKDIIMHLKGLCSRNNSRTEPSITENSTELPIAGFVQMVILFFQVASLLQVKFKGGEQQVSESKSRLRESITELFNFRYTIYQQLCPSDELTLPQKEMILFGMKLTTFIHLLSLAIAYATLQVLARFLRNKISLLSTTPSEEPSIELTSSLTGEELSSKESDLQEEIRPTLSFMNMLKFTFIKLLKLYFIPVIKSALMMVHCVTIRDESHLYVYADQVCYSIWQWGILLIMLPGLLMFPICFEMILRLLKGRQISSWQFIIAAAFPYYGVILYFWKRTQNSNNPIATTSHYLSKEEHVFRKSILESEEWLFREIEGRSLGWQIVQLYRSFAITFLSIFIINPIYRQLTYAAIFLVFIVHDRNREPYKHPYLNLLQCLTCRCLLLVLLCNVIPAMSYLVNVQTIPSIYEVVRMLGMLELVIFAVVPLSLPIWKIKSYIDNRHKIRTE